MNLHRWLRFSVAGLLTGCIACVSAVGASGESFQDFLKRDSEAFERFQSGKPRERTTKPARASDTSPAAILAEILTPSETPRTLEGAGGVRVTLPGGALSEETRITIHEVPDGGPIPFRDLEYKPLTVVQLELNPAGTLQGECMLELPYSTTELNPHTSPESQLEAMLWHEENRQWTELPRIQVDASASRAIIPLTGPGAVRLVSGAFDVRPVSEQEPSRASPGFLVTIGGIVMAMPAHGLYEYAALDYLSNSNNHFTVMCDAATIRKDKRIGDAAWKKTGSSYSTAMPNFVTDLTRYADASLAAYTNAGFACPALPIKIKIDSWLVRGKGDPGMYDYTWGRIHLNTRGDRKLDHKTLRHRIAHEVFHACQRELTGWGHAKKIKLWSDHYLWWIEACAEYASCRVPWVIYDIGDTGDVYGRLLKYPLPKTGQPAKLFGDMEYDKGLFIDYLSRQQGFNFKDMSVAGAAAIRASGSVLGALDTYLKKATHLGMTHHYPRFACWFLLSEDVGTNAPELHSCPIESSALRPYGHAAGKTTPIPVSWTVVPPKAYSALMWKINIEPTPARAQWVNITAEELDGAAVVECFTEDSGGRQPGLPSRVGVFSASGETLLLRVETDESLYVIASNPTESLSAAARLKAAMAPPLDMKHQFEPPHAEKIRLRWDPPEETPANVNGLRVFVQRGVPRDPNDPYSPCSLVVEMVTNVLLEASALEAILPTRNWGSRIGKVGLAYESQETLQRSTPEGGLTLSPIYWGEQQLSTWRDYWDAAQARLKRQYMYRVDWGGTKLREGLETRWYENGKKEIEGTRLRNQLHGRWKRWFNSGELHDTLGYDKGSRLGPYVAYSASGTTVAKGSYERDRKVGRWVYFYDNGRPLAYGNYVWKSTTNHEHGAPANLDAMDAGLYHQVGNKTGTWTYFDNAESDCEPRTVDYD